MIVVGGYSRHADLHADEGIGNGGDGIVAGVCDDAAGLEEGVDGIGVGNAIHAGVGAVDEVGLVYLRPVGVEHRNNAHVFESVDVVGVNKEDVGYAVASVLAAVHLLRVLYRVERLLDGSVARAVHVDAHTGLVDGRDALVHVVGIPYLVAAPALGAAVGLLVRLKQEGGDGFENAVHEELDGTGLEHVAAFVVSVLGLDYLLDLLGALMRVHPVSAAEVYLQLALVVELLYSLDGVGVYVQPGVVCAGEAEGEYLVLIRQNAFLVLLDGEVGQGVEDEVLRLFTEAAVRAAVGVALYAAVLGVGGVVGDAGDLNGLGVAPQGVERLRLHDYGDLRGDLVEGFLARADAGEHGLKIALSAQCGQARMLRDELLHCGDVFLFLVHAGKVDADDGGGGAGVVRMAFKEGRHQHLPAEIDDLGLRADVCLDTGVIADVCYLSVNDGDGFRDGAGLVRSVDDTVFKDYVCFHS